MFYGSSICTYVIFKMFPENYLISPFVRVTYLLLRRVEADGPHDERQLRQADVLRHSSRLHRVDALTPELGIVKIVLQLLRGNKTETQHASGLRPEASLKTASTFSRKEAHFELGGKENFGGRRGGGKAEG